MDFNLAGKKYLYLRYTDKNQYPFRPGMSATVDIFTDRVEDVVTVPIQAVTAREEEIDGKSEIKEIVFVIQADSVQQVEVITGIQDDQNIYIKAGANSKYLLERTIYKPNQELYSDDKPEDLQFLSEGFVGFGAKVNYGNWQIRAGMNVVAPIKSPFFSVNMELGMFYCLGCE